jgi:hypothetical protein
VFERAKTVHALDGAATLIGLFFLFFFPKAALGATGPGGPRVSKPPSVLGFVPLPFENAALEASLHGEDLIHIDVDWVHQLQFFYAGICFSHLVVTN